MADKLLLNHQCQFRNNDSESKPIPYLDLAFVNHQMEVVASTTKYLSRGHLLQCVTMYITKKMSTRKLNNCGIITGHCKVINYEEGTKRANNYLYLTTTVDYIKSKEQKLAYSKNWVKEQGMQDCALKAAAKKWDMSVIMQSWINTRDVNKY